MPTVLTVGSLHYDIMVEADHLPRRDETATGSRWYPKFGGKGGNQAVAARKAGAASRMVGAVGDDAFGAFLRQALRQAGVEDDLVATLPGVGSGMSVALQDGAGDYAATIVSGANLRIDPAGLSADAVWRDVACLVLQNEAPGPVNIRAAAEARQRGVPTILNAAPYRALSSEFRQLVDVLVVNAVEAEMMGTCAVHDLPSAAAAARHLSEGVTSVIVTAGSAGLAGWTDAGTAFQIVADKVAVVSSHGAGDAFIGTLAACLAGGQTLRDACQSAAHAAARHVGGL